MLALSHLIDALLNGSLQRVLLPATDSPLSAHATSPILPSPYPVWLSSLVSEKSKFICLLALVSVPLPVNPVLPVLLFSFIIIPHLSYSWFMVVVGLNS